MRSLIFSAMASFHRSHFIFVQVEWKRHFRTMGLFLELQQFVKPVTIENECMVFAFLEIDQLLKSLQSSLCHLLYFVFQYILKLLLQSTHSFSLEI